MSDEVTRDSDRAQIEETLLRYCRACDRIDEAALRSAFHPDATDEHGGLFAGKIADVIPTMMAMRRRLLITTHALSNISIELEGNSARSESYVTAYHRYMHEGAEYEWVVGARYIDRHEKRGGVWKILNRQTLMDWSKVMRIEQKDPPESLLKL
jgi:SnoaL-like domain